MDKSNCVGNVELPSDFEQEALPKPAILIVDDRMENLVAAKKTLAKLDADIVTVLSGSEALSCCLRQRFAVILMDVQMPVMDGFETAELLAQNDETSGMPIIFVTAISKEEQHIHQGYTSGAVDYIAKPFDPDILISKVKVFLTLENQRMATARLAHSFEQLNFRNSLILDGAAMGILGIDGNGNINFINRAGQVLLGESEDIVGRPLIPMLDGPDTEVSSWDTHPLRMSCVQQTKIHQPDTQIYQPVGCSFAAEYTFSPMPAETGVCGGVLIFQNISARKAIADEMDKMAKYDDLTGVANRRLFRDVLEKRLAGSRRHGRSVGLLYIDIDNFKQVNDTQGHHVGDMLLQLFCERLLQEVRHNDTVGRLGGDEFAVLVDDCSDTIGMFAMAKKLVSICSAPYLIEGRPVSVGISIGIALFPEQADNIDSLFRAADRAMYSVKSSTKNSFALFNTAMQA